MLGLDRVTTVSFEVLKGSGFCLVFWDSMTICWMSEADQKDNSRASNHTPEFYLRPCLYVLEKAMAPHSSTLARKIPWMEEAGRLQTMGSRRVRHDWATSLSLFPFMHWRRKWHPTPVFLPGESQGRGSLVGRRLWGRTESDTTEAT